MGRSIALHDFHAFTRGVLQSPLELSEGIVGYGAAMKEKLIFRATEVTREEFAEQLLMDVSLHRPAGTPAEMAADEEADTVAWLQLDDFEAIELDEIAQQLSLVEAV